MALWLDCTTVGGLTTPQFHGSMVNDLTACWIDCWAARRPGGSTVGGWTAQGLTAQWSNGSTLAVPTAGRLAAHQLLNSSMVDGLSDYCPNARRLKGLTALRLNSSLRSWMGDDLSVACPMARRLESLMALCIDGMPGWTAHPLSGLTVRHFDGFTARCLEPDGSTV